MGITRGKLAIDEHFTAVPNEWARDARLSRRARGLLLEVMSHRVGWHVTIRSLAKAGKEGKDAIQSALNELVTHGYVRRVQSRSGGRFAEIEYELCDPPSTASGFSGHGEESTVSGFTVSGFTGSGESATKKNIQSEDHLEEDQGIFPAREIEPVGPTFAEFWAVWPRKDSRKAAEAAWGRAIRRADPVVIFEAAKAYASSPFRPERQFVPYGATWLNQDRWTDPAPEPPSSPRGGRPSPNERVRAGLSLAQELEARYGQEGVAR